jgi:hypothetical protein
MTGTIRMKALRTGLAMAAMALLLAPVSAAAPIIFDQVEQGGSVVESGGNFTGTNIIFEFVTYNDGSGVQGAYCGTPTFSGLLLTGTTTNCFLNFSTSSNSFTLTAPNGLLASDGVTPIAGTTGILLTGTFSTFGLDGSGLQFNATGIDSKNAALLNYFGIASGTQFTFNNTEIRVDAAGQVTQADLTNTAIPEPGLMTLFGLGLLGVGRKLARRRSKNELA